MDHKLDLSFQNKKRPSPGSVLISDPFLDEDFFRRSVILICNHDEEGSFGLVLNNYLNIDLHELEETFPDIQARISVGGPVDTEHLFFIHLFGDQVEASTQIKDNMYFGGDFDQLKELISQDPDGRSKVRFFLGYSGWAKEQLRNELGENSWIVANNITEQEIFDTYNDELWRTCLEKQGERFKAISKFPLNPNDN
jgi:putative transcriptional regulator